jgi:hypothetical protein
MSKLGFPYDDMTLEEYKEKVDKMTPDQQQRYMLRRARWRNFKDTASDVLSGVGQLALIASCVVGGLVIFWAVMNALLP